MKWVKIYLSCPRVFMNMCTLNSSCTLIYSSDSSLEHYFVCESQGFGFKISLGVSSNKYKLVLLSSSIQNWKYHGQCEFLVKLWPNIIFSEVTTLSTVWKIERYRLNYNILGKYYEMPQKECERYIFRLMAYAFFLNSHFQNQIGKMGHFRKSTWSIWKQKRNRKWNSSILRHFKKCICHHVKNIAFTCFLGNFMILPPTWS